MLLGNDPGSINSVLKYFRVVCSYSTTILFAVNFSVTFSTASSKHQFSSFKFLVTLKSKARIRDTLEHFDTFLSRDSFSRGGGEQFILLAVRPIQRLLNVQKILNHSLLAPK